MSQNAENNDVAHKDAHSSGWKKYVPQRVNSLSRRSLLLTAGCIVAADVVAMMPQFARAGILGDEAAATVSRRKQLEKWERDIRENIDGTYLKVEEFTIQGRNKDDNSEDDLELIGRISITSRGRQDSAGTARALSALWEYGHPESITLEPSDNEAAMTIPSPQGISEAEWGTILGVSVPRYAVDTLSIQKDNDSNTLDVDASLTKGAWNKIKENLRTLQNAQFSQGMRVQYTVQRNKLQVPSGATADISIQVLGAERLNLITMALQDAMETQEFNNLKSFTARWMDDTSGKSSSRKSGEKDSLIIVIDGNPEDLVDVAQTYMREQRVTLEGLKEMHIRVKETIFRGL